MADEQDPLITLPLSVLVKELLGPHIIHYTDHKHCLSVEMETALAIFQATTNTHTCHVQFPADKYNVDMFGAPIKEPLVWDIRAWRLSSERHMRAKIRAKAEKDALDIQRANINRVKKAILKMSGLEPDQAAILAHKWVVNGNVERISMVGVTKLITSIEEL